MDIKDIISLVLPFIAAFASAYAIYISKNREHDLELERRYATPLLKSAEELYNKINDLVRNRRDTVRYFSILSDEIKNFQTIETVFSNPYLTHCLYLFARYFASVEAIKRDLGLFQVASKKETKTIQSHLRQTVAVFFSRRLFNGFHINESDPIKYRGLIFEGTQVLIGDSLLEEVNGTQQCISFYKFCKKLEDASFRQGLEFLIKFLSGLAPDQIDDTDEGAFKPVNFQTPDIDFRWPKLIIFAWYLKILVEQIDKKKIVVLLPELEKYVKNYLKKHRELHTNIGNFEEAFPAPEPTLTSLCKKITSSK